MDRRIVDTRKNVGQHFVGRQIRANKVRCIDNNNTNLGIMSLTDALKLADDCGMDLVQFNSNEHNEPTCKIINYSKFKYEAVKKQKLAAKKQRESEIKLKEIRFRPTTDINDLMIKARQADEFLNNGDRVRVSIMFRGREMTHKNIAMETFDKFMEFLPDAEFLGDISMEGKEMSVILHKVKSNDTH